MVRPLQKLPQEWSPGKTLLLRNQKLILRLDDSLKIKNHGRPMVLQIRQLIPNPIHRTTSFLGKPPARAIRGNSVAPSTPVDQMSSFSSPGGPIVT